MNDFCVFILTHGRPDNVITYKTLRKQGYTGQIFVIIDNEDETADKYYENYGDEVIMFDKSAIAKTFDEGDNFGDRRTIVYARNACFQIAKDLGFEYFIELDDDYTSFVYKFNDRMEYMEKPIKNIGLIFSALFKYYKQTISDSIAIAQNGDFIGAHESSMVKGYRRRKCMNTFFCCIERAFTFTGRINEDVNTYISLGAKGWQFFTVPNVSIIQKTTQHSDGGMTDIYKNSGTYIKSFYTVMYAPSCVKVKMMISHHRRLHHQITWKNAVPVILHEKHKK